MLSQYLIKLDKLQQEHVRFNSVGLADKKLMVGMGLFGSKLSLRKFISFKQLGPTYASFKKAHSGIRTQHYATTNTVRKSRLCFQHSTNNCLRVLINDNYITKPIQAHNQISMCCFFWPATDLQKAHKILELNFKNEVMCGFKNDSFKSFDKTLLGFVLLYDNLMTIVRSLKKINES